MNTHISLNGRQTRELPVEFRGDDVRYTENLVEHFLTQFTKPGDVVFDPFLGFGTTLLVAEKMERIGYGVEFDEQRWSYVRSILRCPERALHGDSTELDSIEFPEVDFSITSPPYMGKHHRENPFTAYTTEFSGYAEYLEQIAHIYLQLAKRLKPSSRAVVEVSNLKHEDGTITTLAWDIAGAISNVMRFEGEVIVGWEGLESFGYTHSYCLVFSKMG